MSEEKHLDSEPDENTICRSEWISLAMEAARRHAQFDKDVAAPSEPEQGNRQG
jgi:hypothetical protein